MLSRHRLPFRFKPSLSFALLLSLLFILWLAGGASRADALGQTVVRVAAWLAVIALILFGKRPIARDLRPVGLLLMVALILVLLQLVPLPPAIWQALPHRDLVSASIALGEAQPWRPWSMTPGATGNAASSMIVPIAALALVAGLKQSERSRLTTILFALVIGSALIGLMQFSGMRFFNPLINATPGEVSGNLANRNHFALLMAIGCLLAPAWAFRDGRRAQWRGLLAIGMILLFALTILASGSRAGMLLGVLAIAIGILLALRPLQRELRHTPRWVLPALLVAVVATISTFVFISVASNRAVSIDRAVTIEGDQDMRVRALPTVVSMVKTYFPAGSGFGGFDPIFRIHEPFNLLKLTYFNHAHNDFLEIILDGGLPALLLLMAAMAWWVAASVRAWRASGADNILPRLGSAIILLVFVASVFDYPARTPIIMAILVVAAAWLARGTVTPTQSALPDAGQSL
ncbi:O-antigen ligase [Sphingomonas faeni]|uniref:O-antigen ligase n=2 Tax=Sphingomonas faeni TaxID=185950 RepID=A0A2T5TXV5_9SPHN|nr:O-antigen ligase [Sphingomonas faeni]